VLRTLHMSARVPTMFEALAGPTRNAPRSRSGVGRSTPRASLGAETLAFCRNKIADGPACACIGPRCDRSGRTSCRWQLRLTTARQLILAAAGCKK